MRLESLEFEGQAPLWWQGLVEAAEARNPYSMLARKTDEDEEEEEEWEEEEWEEEEWEEEELGSDEELDEELEEEEE